MIWPVTLNDLALLAEAEQIRLDIAPNPGADTERIANSILGPSPDLVARLAEHGNDNGGQWRHGREDPSLA